MLSSIQRLRGILPNVAVVIITNSMGGGDARKGGFFPTLVIAKKRGYERQAGLLIPNPYFSRKHVGIGELEAWRYNEKKIHESAAEKPLEKRARRAFWRGECRTRAPSNCGLKHGDRTPCASPNGTCADHLDDGNRARLLGASLSVARSDLFDVKCNIMEPPRNFSCIRDEAYAAELAAARDAIFNTSNPKALHKSLDKKWVFESHYTRYKYVLNFPGRTHGSYSRNLNHLWATKAVVLLWQAPIVEWYYPYLRPGVTHLVVNRSTAIQVVEGLEADPALCERLSNGAARVDREVMSPEGLADYLRQALEAIRRRVRYDLLLDDQTALLALLEETGACEKFVELEISQRDQQYTDKYWDRVTRGRGICDALRALDTPAS
mmetsp:Transcript_497/g.1329  ORF Transcript_497/g.1329 Transcript_497/m.1329 type:complete len:379 (-) Transcript_497:144-1280(-)